MDFIKSFFSWGEKPKEEPLDPRGEIKINNGRDKVSKRFRKPKVQTKEIEEVDVENVDA